MRLRVLSFTAFVACNGDDNVRNDAGPVDATRASDVSVDAGLDVTSDGFANNPPVDFAAKFATAFCTSVGNACFKEQLDASLPPASLASCEDKVQQEEGVLENSIGDLGNATVRDAGHVHVDATAAAACLAGLAAMTLPKIQGAEYATLVKSCLSALTGDVPLGSGCTRTIECADGVCSTLSDAGATCTPTGDAGAPCVGIGSGNDDCMHRGWLGTSDLRCDPGAHVCTPKLALDASCTQEWDCETLSCDDTDTCVSPSTPWTFLFGGMCPFYLGSDAGLQ